MTALISAIPFAVRWWSGRLSPIGEEPAIAAGVDATWTSCGRCATAARIRSRRCRLAERERTGITSLKIGYNRVFGYYIEITNAHRAAIPADYQRRQTLTGAERYVTPALKEYEERVLTRRRAHRGARAGAVRRAAGDRGTRRGAPAARRATGRGARRPRFVRRGRAARAVRPTDDHGGVRARDPRRPAPRRRADDAARAVHPQRRDR